MNFIELAEKRHSVRAYKDMPIEKEKIYQVIEAARIAPSAVNFQPWHFIVLTDESKKSKISEAYPRDWFKKVPAVIVVCGDHSKSWKRKDGKDYCDIDVAIAVDHMILAATDLGLGTCWVCAFDERKCREILNLPENLEVIAMVPMGYPADNGEQVKDRKDIENIVSWEGYRG